MNQVMRLLTIKRTIILPRRLKFKCKTCNYFEQELRFLPVKFHCRVKKSDILSVDNSIFVQNTNSFEPINTTFSGKTPIRILRSKLLTVKHLILKWELKILHWRTINYSFYINWSPYENMYVLKPELWFLNLNKLQYSDKKIFCLPKSNFLVRRKLFCWSN